MLRNYLSAAFRNLGRNKLYAAITVIGLSLGFMSAILIALFARDEYSYDKFIPGYQQVYRVAVTAKTPSTAPIESDTTEVWTAPLLKMAFPQIQDTARLVKSFFPPVVKRGDFQATEQQFYWADPGFFRVLPLKAIAGNPATALDDADGLVVTRAIARKYFGRDTPLGAILLVDGHPLRVTAVLEDPPSNTHLAGDFYASSLAAFSTTKALEKMNGVGSFTLNTLTYLRLKPGVSAQDLVDRLPAFFRDRMPIQAQVQQAVGKATLAPHLVPLADIHLRRSDQGAIKPPGDPQVIAAIVAVGVLIIVIAAINFVTLMTARAGRRALEVGVRKAAGATRGDLVVQFIGEALIYVFLSMLVAVALAELLLPAANVLLQRKMSFHYGSDPTLAGGILLTALAVGLLAGAYPAFVLSAFRPASVLKGGLVKTGGSALIRQGLVLAQFSILIGLIITTVTIARQTAFALNEGMRVNKDQVVIAFAEPCTDNFREQVKALPGVKDAACSASNVLAFNSSIDAITVGDRHVNLDSDPIDFGFLNVYGLKPTAGRGFDLNRPQDYFHPETTATSSIVLNETAVRTLGFASANQAIGRTVLWHGAPDTETRTMPPARPAQIVGVVPDFTFDNLRGAIKPTFYYVGPKTPLFSMALHVKLTGQNTPEVLNGIDRIWKRLGDGRPMIRVFVNQFMMFRYVDALIQGAVIALCAVLALVIACLGLFALSVFTAEQRTKEIGIRKAMGGSTASIVRLLLWQFTKPVLWANLVAWPAAWFVMNRWLHGFAYHVDLDLMTFVAASAAAVLIAWVTVSFQSYLVARAKPVLALRYE